MKDDPLDQRRFRVSIKGGAVAGLRFGRKGAPTLVFSHANGFCASAYRQMFERAGDRFDILAIDLRGHGRTTLPASPASMKSWNLYAGDIADFLDAASGALGVKAPFLLAGHSMGAVASCIAAVGRSDIAAMRFVEPVAMPQHLRLIAMTPLWPMIGARIPMVKQARAAT